MEKVTPQRSALMKRVRQKNTAPEQAVRQILTKLGARYRVNVRDLPGSPDIANKSLKRAIFVHGCFWHGHTGCHKHRLPKNNAEFWKAKFDSNIERDRRKIEGLEARGFRVKVIWECQLAKPFDLEAELQSYWFSESPDQN